MEEEEQNEEEDVDNWTVWPDSFQGFPASPCRKAKLWVFRFPSNEISRLLFGPKLLPSIGIAWVRCCRKFCLLSLYTRWVIKAKLWKRRMARQSTQYLASRHVLGKSVWLLAPPAMYLEGQVLGCRMWKPRASCVWVKKSDQLPQFSHQCLLFVHQIVLWFGAVCFPHLAWGVLMLLPRVSPLPTPCRSSTCCLDVQVKVLVLCLLLSKIVFH